MNSMGLSKLWFYIIGITVGILAITTALRAATFNTFFNNVEQGSHSTSNPTLHISDGKAVKSANTPPPSTSTPGTTDEDALLGGTPPSQPPTATPEATSTAQIAVATSPTPSPHKRYFRFGLLGHTVAQDSSFLGSHGSGNRWGGTLSAGIFPLRDLGLNLFASGTPGSAFIFGSDVEITPLRLNVFDLPNFLQAGLLVGASTLGRDAGLWGTAHVGARLGVNFGDRYGVTAGIRTNLTDRNRFDYVMGDAGFVVHL